MSVIIFILILLVLVLAHEWGHFIVAKKSGIKVEEFGFGFPPRAMTLFTKNETKYTLNWIPFGGFVKIFGQDPNDENTNGPEKEKSFVHKPKYIQVAVLVAGVAMNFIVAWILFSAGYMIGAPISVTEEDRNNPQVEIIGLTAVDVVKGKPAEKSGVESGDIISSLRSGTDILNTPSVESFKTFISSHGQKEITFSLVRGNSPVEIIVVPEDGIISGRPAVGLSIDILGKQTLPLFPALSAGFKTSVSSAKSIFAFFGKLIHDSFLGRPDLSSVSGPVGIVSTVGQAMHFGIPYLLSLIAIISINLAVINLLPFPALDGGRVLFIIIETIIRRPLPRNFSNITNTVGFGLLILLMVVITYKDIVRLVAG